MICLLRALLLMCLWFSGASDGVAAANTPSSAAGAPTYVGGASCVGCHAAQAELWRNSHHDLAMQVADETAVLGDFSGVTFEHYGEVTRFFRRDGGFWIATYMAGYEVQAKEYPVSHTFGVYPLQQYLIPLDQGRLQALTVAWDSRPVAEGGQRWFHLYPNEPTPAGDALHWAGPYQNWNSRCAECHSTHLQRGFNGATGDYHTTWQDMDVNCEACHGPGSAHVAQARRGGAMTESGFPQRLDPVGQWLAPERGTPHNPVARAQAQQSLHPQLSVCGRCHARREVMAKGPPTQDFHQQHRLQLLQAPEYHGDGQVREEDYELGSFLQSKMHREGVVCSNCHDPHSLQLRAPGNGVCLQCHQAQVFDVPDHHHHARGSAGAECVSCHMPTTLYMGVDERHDHSLRIPRPDLSLRFGTPNACQHCHRARGDEWAAEAVRRWQGAAGKTPAPHFSDALAAGLDGDRTALLTLAMDTQWGALVQASALQALSGHPSPPTLLVAQTQLQSDSPLVRAAAVEVLAMLPIEQRWPLIRPLLEDPERLVRLAVAARSTELFQRTQILGETLTRWQQLQQEYEQNLLLHEDMPEGQLNLGRYRQLQGQIEAAVTHYRRALAMNPMWPAAYINLADLYREQGDERQVQDVLAEGLQRLPKVALLHHAQALSLVRQQRYPEALAPLQTALELQPDEVEYGYLYGLLLQRVHREDEALAVWERQLRAQPDSLPLLQVLFTVHQRRGDHSQAITYAERVLALAPENDALRQWLERMKGQK